MGTTKGVKQNCENSTTYEESVAIAKASEPKKLDYELLEAACDGDEKSVANLLQLGAHPYAKDKSDRPVTYLAARQGHEAVVAQLVKNEVDLKKSILGKSMLFLAAEEGSVLATPTLLKHGAKSNQGANYDDYNYSNLPIHIASANGHEPVISEFFKYGVLLDARSSYRSGSQTALTIAASHGNERVVDQLIQMSANVKAEDRFADTPLHITASKGHIEIAARLLQDVENVNAFSTMLDPLGWSEMILLVMYQLNMAKKLWYVYCWTTELI
jgi:ankyrin repeat protein